MGRWDEFPRLESVSDKMGLNDFERFLLETVFMAEVDERVYCEYVRLGCENPPTLSFALRMFTKSDSDYFMRLAEVMSRDNVLSMLFNADFNDIRKTLYLRPEVKRYIIGVEERLRLGSGALTTRVNTVYSWEDIILPDAQKKALHGACNQYKYREVVFEQWGFKHKVSYGLGVRMLFTGPPGTGKTMAAQVIANELGLELYSVDISALVSKYIGETEKNMALLFDGAKNCVLFFDEADAIFGKRGEQKDSHDRYANLQTSYLLQRFENYDGIVVLATNFSQNFDAAFNRRIQCRVDFLMPTAELRKRIWHNLLIKSAPFAADIDTDFLSGRFELTGASIKNIILNAAFSAAAMGTAIDMDGIMAALSSEYMKMDRVISEHELERRYTNLNL